MSERGHNNEIYSQQEEETKHDAENSKRPKGSLLKKAGVMGSALTFLTQPVFASQERPNFSNETAKPAKSSERVLSDAEMSERNLSFQEFISKNPQLKNAQGAEVDLAYFESTMKTSPETGDDDESRPMVSVSYMKNRYPVYNENDLSAYEMALKKSVQDSIAYLPEAKDMQSSSKAVGISINIRPADRWPDYQEQQLYQDGTLREVLAQKKPTALRIGETAIAILSRIRKTERAAREADNALNSQVDNIRIQKVNTKADFWVMDTKVWPGTAKNGKAEWKKDAGQPVSIGYGIETTTSNVLTKDPYGRWSVSTQIQTFRLLLHEDGKAILDGGTVTQTPQGQWRASRPGQGIVSENVADLKLTDYEKFNELMGLYTVNQAIYDLKGIDPRFAAKKPEAKQGSRVAAAETGQIQVLPIDANAQAQCEQNPGQSFSFETPLALKPRQEVLLKGPTAEYRALVFSSKPNGEGKYRVKLNLIEE